MQGLLAGREALSNLSYDADKVINIEAATRRTGNNGDAASAQTERFHNLPGDAHFFLRFRRKRNANRVADAFVQQDAKSNRGFDSASKGGARFGDAEMKWIVDLLRQQAIRGHRALNVGSL